MKIIDLKSSVYDLVSQYPELKQILADLGFSEISKSVMLNSIGKMMTLEKGSQIKGIPMEVIIETLEKNGFVPAQKVQQEQDEEKKRKEDLKEYLLRLNRGEDLESVRKDFAKEFSEVKSDEIMAAEQDLLLEGIPLKEVQRLCDVHSALFHGVTVQENGSHTGMADDNDAQSAEALALIEGHPLYVFKAENKVLEPLVERALLKLSLDKPVNEELEKIKDIIVHYKKKGDLLYPVLKVKYNVTGPHQVMWTVDDEIRDELNKLMRRQSQGALDELDSSRLKAVLERMKEMIYKEENILYPISAKNLSEEDWKQIYQDAKDYDAIFDLTAKSWKEAEADKTVSVSALDEEITIPGGHLSLEQLEWMLNTLPIEITFVDAQDNNCYFNEGHKVFKRPLAAIGRKVFDCHPPKVEKVVRSIIDDLRNHRKENVAVWMTKEGRPFLVDYRAVYNRENEYLGTVEIVQDMSFAKKHFDDLRLKEEMRKQNQLERELEENPSVTSVSVHDYK